MAEVSKAWGGKLELRNAGLPTLCMEHWIVWVWIWVYECVYTYLQLSYNRWDTWMHCIHKCTNPIHTCRINFMTTVDQLLSLSVDYALPDINMLEILRSFSVKRYFLGSPMALSTMMEMRCGPVCYSTKRVPNLYDLQPGECHPKPVDVTTNQYGMVTPLV